MPTRSRPYPGPSSKRARQRQTCPGPILGEVAAGRDLPRVHRRARADQVSTSAELSRERPRSRQTCADLSAERPRWRQTCPDPILGKVAMASDLPGPHPWKGRDGVRPARTPSLERSRWRQTCPRPLRLRRLVGRDLLRTYPGIVGGRVRPTRTYPRRGRDSVRPAPDVCWHRPRCRPTYLGRFGFAASQVASCRRPSRDSRWRRQTCGVIAGMALGVARPTQNVASIARSRRTRVDSP